MEMAKLAARALLVSAIPCPGAAATAMAASAVSVEAASRAEVPVEVADVTAAKPAVPPAPRLPLLGAGLDVGIPDGAVLSVVARPQRWLRLQAGVGNNSISYGWRASACWLPFGEGPGLAIDYGHYAEGNANALARWVVGPGFHASPLLDRVGYDYLNFHLGLNFGIRRVVFYVQGGLTTLWGQVHNLDQVVQQAAGTTVTTAVVLRQDPTIKASGVSAKAGLIAYAW